MSKFIEVTKVSGKKAIINRDWIFMIEPREKGSIIKVSANKDDSFLSYNVYESYMELKTLLGI